MKPERIIASVLVCKPVELVWEKWVSPEDIRQWNIPFNDWYCPRAENDLREGGRFCFRMESSNGKEGFDHKGRYNKIIPRQLIGYTLDDGRQSDVEFQHIDQNTIIRESFEPESGLSPIAQRAFCQAVLDRFKKHVEGDMPDFNDL